MSAELHKILAGEGLTGAAAPYSNTWERQELSDGSVRLNIGASESHVALMLELLGDAPPPIFVMWVLQVPRGDVSPGRYQSPPIDLVTATALVETYADFFERDARHNLWLASPEGMVQFVYDEHNMIYAYGDLEPIVAKLQARGFTEGHAEIPVPHTHPFHAEFDDAQDRLAGMQDFWLFTPLEDQDER